MDEEARDNDHWLEAIAPIYRRSDAGGKTLGRNCELMYLAWETLEELSNSGNIKAQEILAGFLGEFEELCKRGDETGRLANDLRSSLMEIPPGDYRMGSEGSAPEAGEQFAAMIESALQIQFPDPQDAARGLLSRFWHPVAWDQREHEAAIARFARYINQRDNDSIFRALVDLEEPLESKQDVAGFQLGRWPVTNEFYRLFDPEHGKIRAPWCDERTYNKRSGDDKSPVIFVSWYCAWVFCRWVHWGGLSCRLPTEVEWEYACRAGTQGKWCFDGDETRLKDFAWYSDDLDHPKNRTDRVGRRQENAFGLYDMHGNVWEWCADEDPGKYAGEKGWEWIGPVRTLRGGSWGIWANACRSACRHVMPATSREPFFGFRVARDSDAGQ
jgi:formylglycine-generating enzyme required for sulfatase activity